MVAKNSGLSEDVLFDELEHALNGTSDEHRDSRIRCLEDLQRRLASGLVFNMVKAFNVLIRAANVAGANELEALLIRDSLVHIIKHQIGSFDVLLPYVSSKEPNFVLCFLRVLEEMDTCDRSKAVKPLVDFLAEQRALGLKGVKEVFEALLTLGNEGLSKEIVWASLPYLDSGLSKLPAIMYSLKLCSRFADVTVTSKMLSLLEKAMRGYFQAYKVEFYQEICRFIERTHAPASLTLLLELSKEPNSQQYGVISAMKSVLDSNPKLVEHVFEALRDALDWSNAGIYVEVLVQTRNRVEPRRLMDALSRDGTQIYPLNSRIGDIFAKAGDEAKPILLELIQKDDCYEFALETLRKIGIKQDELYSIFDKPPMLQIYDFFYGNRSKSPCDFDKMLKNPIRLNDEVPGKPTTLDYLAANLFSCLNLAVMIVDSSGKGGVDVVCFNQESLDLLVIGCTAGAVKDDLKTMNAVLEEMKTEISDLNKKCTLIPVVLSSSTVTFMESDIRDANQIGVILIGKEHLEKVVEMLHTGRKAKEVLDYIRGLRFSQTNKEHRPFGTY